MRRIAGGLMALVLATPLAACSPSAATGTPAAARSAKDYLVFYADGQAREALAAVRRAGGSTSATDTKLGYVLAKGDGDAFVEALGTDQAIVGVSADRAIGFETAMPAAAPASAPVSGPASGPVSVSSSGSTAFPDASAIASNAAAEPLAARQWDMKMIGADRAHGKAPGTKKVLVGIIDTGVDGKHPDIAPNFNRELSRNFVTDKPKDEEGETLDGPCEVAGCKDPVDADDDGHGTHVASTIGSPINGIGIAGVAPDVQLVNIRAGQDSGFFFLKASLDALTYAADIGVDVVNMSYYVDPWLFNCRSNKADSKKQQLEQRAIITGMQRALDYARKRNVTLISALGNGATDLGHPKVDSASPGYPRGSEKSRKVDNSCINVPAESKGVLSVSALGPTGRKAVYSDYGIEQTDLSAPGGDTTDGKGASPLRSILAAAPEAALRATGKIDKSGKPKSSEVVRDCSGGGPCSYYQYLDGTSMASPHATGVAAILISRFGKQGKGGVALAPAKVEKLLFKTATQKACPSPRKYVYKVFGESTTHTCEGGKSKNGFYGHGVVDAWKAATVKG
ncbi:S8 family peptidase [Nonomuraea rhizosphaerae]|uniref:S8 family peptidase n=1 Tax=Nonomuraea rhizosphaerae TaxID=2665663 RepID=UPI001C5CE7F4|nr:S8 family serine peptidase [Nonomuraea rhizosphaerae]